MITLSVILVIAVLLTVVGPQLVLACSRQPEVEESYSYSEFFDTILSLKYTVDENRQHWYPADSSVTSEVVFEHYKELFYPTETQWREKTVQDFKAATQGVLKEKLK